MGFLDEHFVETPRACQRVLALPSLLIFPSSSGSGASFLARTRKRVNTFFENFWNRTVEWIHCSSVAGIGDPGRGGVPTRRKTGIIDAGYNISDSTSPCHGHSSGPLTNPARTGFSLT